MQLNNIEIFNILRNKLKEKFIEYSKANFNIFV